MNYLVYVHWLVQQGARLTWVTIPRSFFIYLNWSDSTHAKRCANILDPQILGISCSNTHSNFNSLLKLQFPLWVNFPKHETVMFSLWPYVTPNYNAPNMYWISADIKQFFFLGRNVDIRPFRLFTNMSPLVDGNILLARAVYFYPRIDEKSTRHALLVRIALRLTLSIIIYFGQDLISVL